MNNSKLHALCSRFFSAIIFRSNWHFYVVCMWITLCTCVFAWPKYNKILNCHLMSLYVSTTSCECACVGVCRCLMKTFKWNCEIFRLFSTHSFFVVSLRMQKFLMVLFFLFRFFLFLPLLLRLLLRFNIQHVVSMISLAWFNK